LFVHPSNTEHRIKPQTPLFGRDRRRNCGGWRNAICFARPSALPSRTSLRELALANPASSPPVEAATVLGRARCRPLSSRIMWSVRWIDHILFPARLPCPRPRALDMLLPQGKNSSGNNSSSRPPPIPPACCEWDSLRGASKHGRKKPKHKHGHGGGSFSEREWIHLAFCLDYVRRVSSLSADLSCSLALCNW
jgi:hypothetical protein